MEVVVMSGIAGLIVFAGWATFYKKPRTVEDQWRVLREWGDRTSLEINAEKKVAGGRR